MTYPEIEEKILDDMMKIIKHQFNNSTVPVTKKITYESRVEKKIRPKKNELLSFPHTYPCRVVLVCHPM